MVLLKSSTGCNVKGVFHVIHIHIGMTIHVMCICVMRIHTKGKVVQTYGYKKHCRTYTVGIHTLL